MVNLKENIVEIKNCMVSYEHFENGEKFQNTIFNNINCSFKRGGFYFLTGPSGSGKSTFIKLIYGEIKPLKGELSVFGKDFSNLSEDSISMIRQRMGIIFQDCKLIPHLNILNNVAVPLLIQNYSENQSRKYAEEILHWVGLKNYLNYLPEMLSHGQKQRVAIARAVISKPDLLLADEPTGSIDCDNAYRIIHLFEELCKNGTTVILATHNKKLARNFKNKEISIYEGEIKINDGCKRHV